MEIIETTILKHFTAPRVGIGVGGFMQYRKYSPGEKVRGYVWQDKKGNSPGAFITADQKWAIAINATDIPLKNPSALVSGSGVSTSKGSAPAGSNTQQGASTGSATSNPKPLTSADPAYFAPQNIKARLDAIKKTNVVGNVVAAARASSNGMFYGAAAGAIVSVVAKKPFLLSVLVGGIGGGLTAFYLKKHQISVEIKRAEPVTGNAEPATKK